MGAGNHPQRAVTQPGQCRELIDTTRGGLPVCKCATKCRNCQSIAWKLCQSQGSRAPAVAVAMPRRVPRPRPRPQEEMDSCCVEVACQWQRQKKRNWKSTQDVCRERKRGEGKRRRQTLPWSWVNSFVIISLEPKVSPARPDQTRAKSRAGVKKHTEYVTATDDVVMWWVNESDSSALMTLTRTTTSTGACR